jgi:hypothetical protein
MAGVAKHHNGTVRANALAARPGGQLYRAEVPQQLVLQLERMINRRSI